MGSQKPLKNVFGRAMQSVNNLFNKLLLKIETKTNEKTNENEFVLEPISQSTFFAIYFETQLEVLGARHLVTASPYTCILRFCIFVSFVFGSFF